MHIIKEIKSRNVGGECSTNFEMINVYTNVVRGTKGNMSLRIHCLR